MPKDRVILDTNNRINTTILLQTNMSNNLSTFMKTILLVSKSIKKMPLIMDLIRMIGPSKKQYHRFMKLRYLNKRIKLTMMTRWILSQIVESSNSLAYLKDFPIRRYKKWSSLTCGVRELKVLKTF